MKICETCGNEIEDDVSICPFCETPQKVVSQGPNKPDRSFVRKVVLKEGQPTVAQAIDRLKDEMKIARSSGYAVLKIVHGYGSSGSGGAIKKAVLSLLRSWKRDHAIKNFMTGEQHFERGARHNHLLRKYPELNDTWVSDRGNPGITFIEL